MRGRAHSKGERFAIWAIGCVFCAIVVVSCIIIWVIIDSSPHVAVGEHVHATCWVPEGRTACAPQFIVAGAMKTGTTSLWAYLLNHPLVLPLQKTVIDPQKLRTVLAEKEVRFFNDPAYSQLVKEYGREQAISYFLDLFVPIAPTPAEPHFGKITGEASPMYICSPGVANRVYEALPEVKIIIMLRDPIDRAYSDYWFRKSLKRDVSKFEIAGHTHSEIFQQCMEIEMEMLRYCKLDHMRDDLTRLTRSDLLQFHKCFASISKQMYAAEENSAHCRNGAATQHLCLPDAFRSNCQRSGLEYGIYLHQIWEWHSIFPADQIMFIRSEDFYANTSVVMKDVAKFLGIHTVDFDWDRVVSNTFNIINPGSQAGSKQDLFTHNTEAKKGLQIGSSNTTSEYPPLDPLIRSQLQKLVRPYNKALAQLLHRPEFLWDDS